MVLSGLRKAMSGRERVQVSCCIRIAFTADVGCRGARRETHCRFLRPVPKRICSATLEEVCFQNWYRFTPTTYYILTRFGTKRVRVNQVYQEYIADKHHLHMNSTRWVTLTEFTKHLGRTGVGRVDETEQGWFIAWIDSSPKALAKAVRILLLFLKHRLLSSPFRRHP